MRCVFLKTAVLAVIACSICLMSPEVLRADPGRGTQTSGDCGSCHNGPTTSTANASVAPIGTTPGATVKLTATVANTAGGEYLVAITGAPSGVSNDTHPIRGALGNTLTLPTPTESGWSSWSSGRYWTTSAPTTAANFSKDFTFVVPPGTVPDTYTMFVKASNGADDWTTNVVTLQLTVGEVPEPATLVMLLGGALVGLVCWRGRKRLAAK